MTGNCRGNQVAKLTSGPSAPARVATRLPRNSALPVACESGPGNAIGDGAKESGRTMK